MSKYFDGYASFDYKEMSKEKLIAELKEKVRYIAELKRNQKEEISKVQSARDKKLAELKAINKELLQMNEMFLNPKPLIDKLQQQLKEKDQEIEKFNKNWTTLCDYLGKMIVENGENEDTYSNILEVVNKLHHYNPKYSDKFTTHQVCEKIREKLPRYVYSFQEPDVPRTKVIEYADVEFILDQIEEGENNDE